MGGGPGNGKDDDVTEIEGVKIVTRRVSGLEKPALRALADSIRDRLGSGVVVLAAEHDGKVALLVSVTKDLAGRVHAGNMVKVVAPIVGGRGGDGPISRRRAVVNPIRSIGSCWKAERSWGGCSREPRKSSRLAGHTLAGLCCKTRLMTSDETDGNRTTVDHRAVWRSRGGRPR